MLPIFQPRFVRERSARPIFCMAAAALLLVPGLTSASEDGGHGKLPHHHLALFVGGGVETQSGHSDHGGFAVGLEYEYRFHERWGVGAVVEALGQDTLRDNVVAVPVSFHPGGHWRLFAGPGIEFTDKKNKFVVRTGVGYEIPLGGK